MAQKSKGSIVVVCILIVILGVAMFGSLSFLEPTSGVTAQPNEPGSLEDLIGFDNYTADLHDLTDLTDPERVDFINNILADDGYKNVSDALGQKGFQFDTEQAAVSIVNSPAFGGFSGYVMSMWSTNMSSSGTRAFISAAIINGFSLVVGGITNLLPPDQVEGVDPYIIVNAMPYVYLSLYWWVWAPQVAKIHTWHYWWYDSHSHPNWYWGVYWWWRTDVEYYWLAPGYGSWQPWWWWFWHWTYWRHWYWWSTYFPYV